MKRFYPYILFLSILSCRREEPTTWNTNLSAPLIHSHLTLTDLVADSLLTTDETGLWHLVISENLTDFDLDTIVAIPDTTVRKSFVVPDGVGTLPLNAGQDLFVQDVNTVFDVNDVELKEVLVKSGTLEYFIKNYTGAWLYCVYTIPGVTLASAPVVLAATTSPGTDADPSVQTGQIDLAGYHIDLTGESGTLSNTIFATADVEISELQPGSALISELDSVSIELHFIEPKVEYARGYFGQHTYDLNEVSGFGDSFSMPSGAINIEEVSLDFKIENYVGADAQIDLSVIGAINSNNASQLDLLNPDIYETINVTRAYDNNGNVIPEIETFTLDNSNSNIDQFVEFLPDSIMIGGSVIINPLGDVSDGNDFIYTSQALNANMEIDIPLCIGMQDLVLEDTLEISGSADLNANGSLLIDVVNGFPFSTELEILIIDQSGNILSTIMSPQEITSGSETSNPGEIDAAQSNLVATITTDGLQHMHEGNLILLRVTFNTPSLADVVKIYEDYFIDIKVRAEMELEVEIR